MYSHPVNVAFISYVIGKWMYYDRAELSRLVCTGLLHDIGKAKIKDSILNKPDKLTEDEMKQVRKHPVLGYQLLTELNFEDTDILIGVLSHHERQDGTGYPRMVKGDKIGDFGKIIAIADIYDAMTSTRPYSESTTPFKAIEEIQELGFGLLDPQICQIFLNNIINFYYGSVVRLNNERIGEIIYVNPEERTRPLIHCEDEYINLTQERDIEIVEMLE
jgi:HD-GYP domain-containing protein (c-di-GMP phosphodiesterase class II)